MRYYLKKLAISGAVSATLFAGLFYFVYAVENEKYAPKTSSSEKTYTEETISEVNAVVAQAIEQEVAKSEAKIARAPVIQKITTAPSQTTTVTTPIIAFDIPSLPSSLPSSAPITTPVLPTIAIPAIPTPTPAPAPRTSVTTPAPVQPKPAPAPAPRTTVS